MLTYEKASTVPMKVLYFGIYSKRAEYPRNNNLIRSLRVNGAVVTEAHFKLAGSFFQRIEIAQSVLKSLYFFIGLFLSYIVLTWKFIKTSDANVIIVGHPGYFHIHLAQLLRIFFKKNALLVYDVFIPLYEALVEDRNLVRPNRFLGRLLHRFEKSCCRQADVCLIDTEEHRLYLSKEYGLSYDRIVKIFVGSTIKQQLEPPQTILRKSFKVLYVGTYIPLHGVDIILNAARLLEKDRKIHFFFVGCGQLRDNIETLASNFDLPNLTFHDWIPTEHLGTFIRSFDLSLGVFGSTPKTSRVIPSKIFDICAAGVPFITANTPAIREAFIHCKNAYLIRSGSPESLANAIKDLKLNKDLRYKIGIEAWQTANSLFSLKTIGKDLISAILFKQQL